MRTRLTRQPGQPGTKQLLAQYGAELICVRYRYDDLRGRRLKTVELVVELQVGYEESEVQRFVKAAGVWWNATRKVWELRYDKVEALELTERLVPRE